METAAGAYSAIQNQVSDGMKARSFLVLLLLLLLAETLTQEDLGGKVFLFPKEGATAHVILQPKVKKPLQQFSVCLRSYSELSRSHSLFSLATPEVFNMLLIFPAPSNRHALYINDEHQVLSIDSEKLGWKKTCVTCDSTTGVAQLWINGKPYPRRLFRKGFTIGADTSIMLGQEQDSYGGGFFINDSFVGEMSDVHMWDYVLTPEQMFRDHQGNLLNWKSLNYQIKGEVLVLPELPVWGSN